MARRWAAAVVGIGLALAAGCASAPAPADEEPVETAALATMPQPPLPLDEPEVAAAREASDPPGAIEVGEGAEAAVAPAERPEQPVQANAPPPADGRPRDREPVRRELIVVDEGSSAVRPTPGELARTTRREAGASPGSPPRITNENLADYARRGQVTMAGSAAPAETPEAAAAGAAPDGEDAVKPVAETVRDEAWWRARAREIREEWRHTVDEIATLEAAAADLRWRFYAEDDPWLRDREVKPEWDRALDRLSEARRRLDEYPRRLDDLVEEGRREGALPGWLREGIELEPQPEDLPGAAEDPAEPVEPREVDERPQGGGR